MSGQAQGDSATSEIGPAFLAYLRATLGAPALGFVDPPTPISGGFDTRIYAFSLAGAPAAWAGPLILRVLRDTVDPRRALLERAVQNAVAGLGYPAPRVLAASADRGSLGGGFLVMKRVAGRPLLDAQKLAVGDVLAAAHARLHSLDPEPLLRAFDDEARAAGGGRGRHGVSYDAYLTGLDTRVRQAGLDGLVPATRWLAAQRPAGERRVVICHGDFHPQNLLVERGRLTAVLDWPNVVVAPPEFDVASTRVLLALTPLHLLALPAALRPLVALLRRVLLARYLAAYRRRIPLDAGLLAYYEVAACMRGLVRAAMARVAGGEAARNPLDASDFGERLAARVGQLTGVAVTLPPRAE